MADAKFFSKSQHTFRPCWFGHAGPSELSLTRARGKTQELRDELRQANDKRDKGFLRKKTALKKIVANMTMGNDSELRLKTRRRHLTPVSPLFPDIVQCMQIQVLEIKKSTSQ